MAICGMYATMRAYGLLYEAIIMSDLTAPRTIFVWYALIEALRCFYLHLTTFINTCDDRYGMPWPRTKKKTTTNIVETIKTQIFFSFPLLSPWLVYL